MSKKLSTDLKKLRREMDPIGFRCKKDCYECCTSIDYTEEESKRMNQCLRKQGLDKPPNGKGKEYCEYLTKEGKCSVYTERPIICRAFGKVKSPFLTCSYFRDCKQLKQSLTLFKYMARRKSMIRNKNGVPSQLTKGIEQGDPKAVMLMVQQMAMLVEDGILSREEFKKRTDALERIMNKKNDSIHNYLKK